MQTLEHKKFASSAGAAVQAARPHQALPQRASPVVQRAPSCACGGSCPRCQAKSNLKIGAPDDAYEQEADAVADQVLSGECAGCKSKGRLQAKLSIGVSNDPLEREADRTADRVLAAPTYSAVSSAPPRIQRVTGQANGHVDVAPASVDQALASPGRPLDTALRLDMEQRFGHDFSRVRVHTDATAAQSAQDVNAQAYTVGNSVVFDASRFAPGTSDGRRLLAHELTHVVQQEGASALWLFRQPDLAGSGLTLTTPEPRSLRGSLDVRDLDADELDLEIELIQQWLNAHPQHSESEHLRSELKRLQSAPKLRTGPFEIRFYQAWSQAAEALRKEVRRRDKESYDSSITRGLMKVEDLAVSPEEVWKHGLAGNLFLGREKQLVDAWSQKLASKTFSKRYDAAKYGRIYGTERYYESSGKRRDDDTEIWSRGVAYGLFLPTEKAAVLRIPLTGVSRAAYLTQRIKAVDPKSPEAAKLIDEIHDFTSDPAIVLLGPEVEKLLGPFGYTYRGGVEAPYVAHDINTAYKKSLEPNQVRKVTDAPIQVRWDECMRRRSLDVNNLEAAEFDPVCFKSENEFQQELVRRAQEFRTRYQGCGHSRPSHFKCRDEVAAEYFPAGQARQDAIRRWAYGQLEIYKGVVQGGVVSQTGFHFAHDVLGWSTERSAAFGGALSTGTSLGLGYVHRRAALQKPPSNPPPPPPATTEVVGKPKPMPKPDAGVVKGAPNAPVKPSPVEVKPPVARPAVGVKPPVAPKPKVATEPAARVPVAEAPPVIKPDSRLAQAEERLATIRAQAGAARARLETAGEKVTAADQAAKVADAELALARQEATAARSAHKRAEQAYDKAQRTKDAPRAGPRADYFATRDAATKAERKLEQASARAKAAKGDQREATKAVPRQEAAVGRAERDVAAAQQQRAIEIEADRIRKLPANVEGLRPGWDYAHFPLGPRRAWQPGDAINMPDANGNYPVWATVRPRIWRNRATDELAARAAGTRVRATIPPRPKGPVDPNAFEEVPKGGLPWLDPIRSASDKELAVTARSGSLPSYHGAEIEHARIPQRAGDKLVAAGVNPNIARRVTKVGDPDNLMPTRKDIHAIVDESARVMNPNRNPTLKFSLDVRTNAPFREATDAEIANIVKAIKNRKIIVPKTEEAKQKLAKQEQALKELRGLLEAEKKLRPASAWEVP